MIRVLPAFIELALLIYCLIDCIQTDSVVIRNLSKGTWILVIIVLPLIGGIAWLVAGRPERAPSYGRGSAVPWRATQTAGFPEYERPRADTSAIDDRLRREQEAVDREHEGALRGWEASLRERERKLDNPDA